MSAPHNPVFRGRRWLGGVIAVLICLVGGWLYLIAGAGGGELAGPVDRPTQAQASSVSTTQAVTTAPGSSLPARLAQTQPVRSWSAPRFKARQGERDAMVETIVTRYRLKDRTIVKAMAAVPRHEFVPEKYLSRAYADTPLRIGHGQTISQPYIVAEMTRLLELKGDSRVLEIGTGSGYQAAVLTEFTPHVCTIEIVKPLAESAKARLKRLGYHVVRVRWADGYYGWPEKAPFDAIVVTCAAAQIPPPLIKQLAPGGTMVIPVGGPFSRQSLMLVRKDKRGNPRVRSLMPVRFVPFIRKHVPAK